MISWLCFSTTLASTWFGGSKKLLGPIFGMVGFIPWTIMAVDTEQWGLLALNCVIFALQARAFILWRRDGSPLW